MRVVSLASGSSGNALLVEDGSTRVLVDAGLQPRTLVSRLHQAGVKPDALQAILLTHEHHDHACGAVALACLHGIPLVADAATFAEVMKLPSAAQTAARPQHHELRVGRGTRLGTLEVRSFALSHDAAAPCGYVLGAGAWSVCVAVDTGEVTAPMAEALRTAHLLVVEANHDEDMLHAGPYPWHLKRRIRSATGHLSNLQTALALAEVLDGGPRWVWLAHLSRTNNRPALAVGTVQRHLLQHGHERVVLQAAPPDFGPTWESPAMALPDVRQVSLWNAGPTGRPPADVVDAADRVAEGDAMQAPRGASVGARARAPRTQTP